LRIRKRKREEEKEGHKIIRVKVGGQDMEFLEGS
jgi:hypothetical protein